MNKIFISILFTCLILTSFSQDCFQASKANWGEDSLECRKNVSLYSEFMKQKVFADAAIFWTKTQKFCPQYKPNLYKNSIIKKNDIKNFYNKDFKKFFNEIRKINKKFFFENRLFYQDNFYK